MPVFIWEGRTRTGDDRNGEIEADNIEDAERQLRAQQFSVDSIKKRPMEIKLPSFQRVGVRELVIFTRQFSTMIDAGLPIVQALDLLQGQEPNLKLRRTLQDVKLSVETGSTFADALRKHPKIFDVLYTNLVEAGETGGILDSILNRLAVYMEKASALRKKLKGAVTYPIGVLIVAMGVIVVMLWKVIPTFEEMFSTFGNAELPGPTQFVVDISHGFTDYLPLLTIGLAGFIFGTRFILSNPHTRAIFDKLIIKMPIIGPVVRKAAVARFTRTFGTMVSSGVPILDALEIVAHSAGNMEVEKAILYTRSQVEEGRTLVDPLMETGIFPQMVVQMIGVGEATGALDAMLNKIADFYEEEVDAAVDGLTSLIEPIMMVGLGGLLAGLMLAMYLPIFSIAETIK